jgi:hypothetical protein
MSRNGIVTALTFLVLGVGGAPAWSQEADESKPALAKVDEKAAKSESKAEARPERPPFRPTTNLRVQLVMSRYRDDKKTGSLPYTFTVTPGGARVRMRMGVEAPIPTAAPRKQADTFDQSFSYRSVGTNVDCFARDLGNGSYELSITVENSSAIPGEKEGSGVAVAGVPLFRKFETSFGPVMRDGQTIQTIASTDPVTGEVVKIDVTMNVVK